MLLVTFVALSLLANLRTMLKRKLPAHENIRAVDCDIMDFNEEYTLSDYYTISEMLTELKSVVAIRSHRTQQTRLINLTSKQKVGVRRTLRQCRRTVGADVCRAFGKLHCCREGAR